MSAIPPLEKRRIRVTTGLGRPHNLTTTHPFVQQETNKRLDDALTKLKTRYARGRARISDLFDGAGRDVLMVTPKPDPVSSDVWCIDPRGVLTMSLCKESYEEGGFTGSSLPFRNYADRHVVQIQPVGVPEEGPMGDSSEPKSSAGLNARNKQKGMVERWEGKRKSVDGLDGWDVVYCSSTDPNADPGTLLPGPNQVRQVSCARHELRNVQVPDSPATIFHPRPNPRRAKRQKTSSSSTQSPTQAAATDEALEDWETGVFEMIEWTGMAMLGAQRLQANDQVNPYAAVYDPPHPSTAGGDVTHLSWRGLLSPPFVQSIIDTVSLAFDEDGIATFASITLHGMTISPVGYLPSSKRSSSSASSSRSENDVTAPPRLPRENGEDTSTLFIDNGKNSSGSGGVTCVLVESIGQYDMRWG